MTTIVGSALLPATSRADMTITILGDSNNPGTATLTVSGELIDPPAEQNDEVSVGLWFPQDAISDTATFFAAPLDSIDYINSEGSPAIDISLSKPILALHSGASAAPAIASFDTLRLEDDGGSSGDDWGLVSPAQIDHSSDPRTYTFMTSSQEITFGNQSGFNALTPGTYSRTMFLFGDTWNLVIIDKSAPVPVAAPDNSALKASLTKKIRGLKKKEKNARRKGQAAKSKKFKKKIKKLTMQLRSL